VLAAPRGAGPGTAACRSALDALQRLEAEAIGAREAAPAGAAAAPQRLLDQVKALRREAAKACLGGSGDAPPPTASTQPPLSIAPLRADQRLPAATRPATVPVPAVTIPRPVAPLSVTNCDANGCWASDGSRLNRIGSSLVGPRGVCSVQGSLLNCP
jgi:hypothetical protein